MSVYFGNSLVGASIAPPLSPTTPYIELMNTQETWTRPSGWPDLDSLNLTASGDDYIYMTYDADKEISAVALKVEGTNISVSIGHLSSGSYVSDATITGSSNQYVLWLDSYSGYKVVKVTGTTITRCYNITVTNGSNQTQVAQQAPILERIAYLPHFNGYGSAVWGTYSLQREKFMTGPTSALVNLSYMWANCYNLKDLDVSNVDTSNVTNLSYAFSYCLSLRNLDLSNWIIKDKVSNFSYAFNDCISLKRLLLSNWTGSTTTNYLCSSMFSYCYSLEEIPGIENLVSNKTNSVGSMFYYCYSLKDVSFLKTWDTSNVTSLSNLFTYCYSLTTINLSSFDISKVTSLSSTFNGCQNLRNIIFPTVWDTSKVTTFNGMFTNCRSLKEISNIANWSTAAATNFGSMFTNCQSLETLNLNSWNTTNVTTFNGMFTSCWNLRSVGTLANWSTANVTNFANMFSECYSLESIPTMTNWNFAKATSLSSMFSNCWNIKEVILPNLTLTLCTSTSNMFYYCYNLETVNVGGWSIPAITTAPNNMFNSCYSLKNVIGVTIPTLNISFSSCNSLTHESLLVILNALPNTETTRTINIVTNNINRLTAAEKAIATDKGWTLAN